MYITTTHKNTHIHTYKYVCICVYVCKFYVYVHMYVSCLCVVSIITFMNSQLNITHFTALLLHNQFIQNFMFTYVFAIIIVN